MITTALRRNETPNRSVEPMVSERFLMGRGREALSFDEQIALEDGIATITEIASRKIIVRREEPVDSSMLLLEGIACRYKNDREGRRQLVATHVPGDFIDLHGFVLGHLDHDIATIGSVKVAVFRHQALKSMTERLPYLTQFLWLSTLLDAAMHREWIFRLGRLGADGRVAHLLCELYVRFAMVGLVEDGTFALPMTQPDLAEATGLTGVHVNRVLRTLRERDLAIVDKRKVRVLDWHGLASLGEFVSTYLYGSTPIR